MSSIILASKSPRRRELIALITDDFEVITAEEAEILPAGIAPEDAPAYLAQCKAQAVAKNYPDKVVIGADTVVLLDGEVLGKPRDAEDAFAMLRGLSGRAHTVITGCCLIRGTLRRTFSVTTRVEFYPLSDSEIAAYIATGEPFDKAGAYGIQGIAAAFVESLDGDYFNVMGLPICRVCEILGTFGIGLFDRK